MKKIKIGDRLLVKRLFSLISHGAFHANVIAIHRDLFGTKYLCRHHVNTDFGEDYDTCGYFRPINVLMID